MTQTSNTDEPDNKTEPLNSGPLMSRNSSVLTLTTPQLYSIYGGGENLIDAQDADTANDIYENLKDNIRKRRPGDAPRAPPRSSPRKSAIGLFPGIVGKSLVLCVLGNLFIKLIEQLYKLNPALPNLADFRLIYLVRDNVNLPLSPVQMEILNNSVMGLLFGSIRPLSELVFTWNGKKRSFPETAALVRFTVALVGFSYGLRKVEWDSKLEASLVFLGICALLWIVMDSSIGGLLSSFIVSLGTIVVYTYVTFQQNLLGVFSDPDTLADLLWNGSFLFISLVIFGRISKRLIG
ncbi:hypothetical protein KL921_001829 [Ogataea angusta]|uniref:Uncharacterized protein n=1 Tax=Pichia angusta TaxID=870730 RepID=A0AAN6I702_PICAN|nr:uncharacterized protein KL928_002013 [Ogataea angusta]KAG7811563.1 hypothetical protein KL921_001829 [Ogataea angusta]KAG7819339.1 hypothetical protein KL928_002013 [Ogataea angusta]KAG7824120.1 hypothetical protein KL909_002118 [Ogataea angusta]KAG7831087.1 hypothetical protein KL920_001678 [Ogataea angusta]KAG7835308.1 hypothetical protein KL943_002623 [Ogataea angusta]